MSEVSPRPDAAALATLSATDKRRLLAELLAAKKSASSPQRFPLSFAQQRLWFIDRLLPGQTAYLIPVALRLDGALDHAALHAGLQLVVQRHEILRTRIVEEAGEPLQLIEPQADLSLPLIDLTAIPPTLQAGAIDAELRKLVAEPFDLARGPLLRCRLLALGAQAHVLLVVIHHIVADYWSLRVLMRELALAYAAAVSGKAPALPSLPIQYVDYAAWQRTQTAQEEAGLTYWREQLHEAPALLQLPTDRPRGRGQRARGARHGFQLPAELAAAVNALAQREQTTPFVVLLTALQCVLYRYSGQDDFCVGSTVSNRDRAETRDLIGLFVNNLVLRGRFAPTLRFRDVLRKAHETVMGALAHQELPFERVVDALQVERRLERHALFQVMFVLHNTAPAQVELPGLRLSAVDVAHDGVRFDLSLDMTATSEGLHGLLEYNAALFDRATIENLSRHFHRALAAAVDAPDLTLAELPLLDADDLRALEALNRTAQPIDERPAHRRFVAQAARTPQAIALCAGGRRYSYAELDAWTNRLARHLLARGARPGAPIAICLPRGAELVASLLAVLKLGACYVPLDPTHPPARLRHVLEDAAPTLLIVDARVELPRDLLGGLSCIDLTREAAAVAGESASELAWTAAPDALAYVMYTSGSTGKPKGVPIAHLSLSNLLDAMASAPGLTAADALLAVTTIAFDIASLEVLLPLSVGARLVLADEHSVVDAARLAALLDDEAITCMQATPATWRLLLDDGWRGRPGLKMLCGGEALEITLARRLLDCGAELWNLYGPTETTIWSSALRLDAALLADGVVPLGGPIANTQFHLLDVCGQLAPTGVAGELVIGGAGLSPGYLGRPALSAEKFKPHALPASDAPLHCYHTGDRLRRRADGLFEFLGRLDHQIKLRGYRIELGEIEAVLNAHPALTESLVVLREDGGEPRLVAYCVVDEAAATLPAELRQLLLAQLPAYMLPAQFVLLEALPRTPNGKIDRQALPAPRDAPTPGRPLSTPTEEALAELWQALLGRAVTSADDEFFALGGHSLLAARLIAHLQTRFEIALPLRLVFERPSLAALAAAIDESLDGSVAGESVALKIEPRPPGAPPVLSHAQERLWVLAQLDPDAAHYHMPAAVRLEGRFSLSAFEAALRHVCARHDVLQTAFPSRQGKAAIEWRTSAAPAIAHVRLDEPDPERRAARLAALLREAALAPFDFERAPLLRALVVELGEREHVILLVMHHLLGDAWSLRLLFAELRHCHARFLAGQTPALPALSLRYADYAAWERGRDTSASLAYWQRTLAGAPALLDLPTDYPRGAQATSAGDEVRFSIDAATRDALAALSRRHGATLFMCLLAAYKLLLHRFSGETDLVVGCPVGHRPAAALEGVMGVFVNTLAIRTDLAACRDFTALLAAVRAKLLDGFAHQDAPFEAVVNALALPRHWQHTPLFQVMFLWQSAAPEIRTEEAGGRWIPLPLATGTAKVDLSLIMAEEDGALLGRVEYRRDLFHRATIEMLIEAFKTLLSALAAAPECRLDALPVVSPAQTARLAAWNDTARDYPVGACLHQAFEQQAAATPAALAIVVDAIAEDGELSYAALDAMANRIAHCLQRRGVQPESRVAVCMARRPGLIAALLGVLKAGGAYVPIDPAYPRTRVDYMLADAAIDIVVTDEAHRALFDATSCVSVCIDELPEDLPATAPSVRLSPRNAAYVIYTSGSTGAPKGVTIEHASPVALVHWAREVYGADELRGVLAATSICFDLSIFEIFVPLSTGGTIVLADHALQLPELAARAKVTLVNTVPTAAAELARDPRLPASIQTFNIAGEPLSTALVRELYARPGITAVYNLYGPSEDTTYSTFGLMAADEAGASSPIGRPIANTRAYVLDARLAPVASGMPGELYLAGAGLARGYWGRPALTAERFLPNPFASEREPADTLLYKTGDRVRFRHDGQLEFLGRLDEQVKIRGFRIEPGEIEAALLAQPEIAQATVQPWTDAEGRRSLVAYLVPAHSESAAAETLAASSPLVTALRAALARRLPDFMLPAYFVALPALPLLPNGKIARGALPPPQPSDRAADEETMSAQESALAAIWRQALGRGIGLHDNFFALGGDSILALSVIAQARAAGLHFTPRDLFEHPTVAGLAAIASATALPLVTQGPQIGRVPLSPIQHWFFELPLRHRGHWNQTILLEVKEALDDARLAHALQALMKLHDGLRARFVQGAEGWEQHYGELDLPAPLTILRVECASAAEFIEESASALQAELALDRAPLWRAAYYDLQTPAGAVRRLLLVCHHLLVDGVSWRILLSDLLLLYRQDALPPAAPGALSRWLSYLRDEFPVSDAALAHWRALAETPLPTLPLDLPQGRNLMGNAATVSLTLAATTTQSLLQEVPATYAIKPDELLLTALAQTLVDWQKHSQLRLELEAHGRPDGAGGHDLSRSLGWVTALFPVAIDLPPRAAPGAALKTVKQILRSTPDQGLSYGVLRYLRGALSLRADAGVVPLRFNYLGQTDQLFDAQSPFAPAPEATGASRHPADARDAIFDVNVLISRGELRVHWTYGGELHHRETVLALARDFLARIAELVHYCLEAREDDGHVAADFPQMEFAPGELEDLLRRL